MTIYNPNIDLVNENVYIYIEGLVSICLFVLKIWSKNQILTPTKGHNSVTNLQKMMHYNHNVDLVNNNVYTQFIFQDFEALYDNLMVRTGTTILHLSRLRGLALETFLIIYGKFPIYM